MNEKWEAVKTPPANALKKIVGGRLKGMTDIKPQWRYEIMTETYGMCGVGWKYEITEKRIEDGSDGQKIAFVDVNLYIADEGGMWGQPIPGTGGSMMIAKEQAGLHTNDECFKMALTDALSVAMAKIGVAADIYMGLWDGSKYITTKQPEGNGKKQKKEPLKEPIKTAEDASKEVIKKLKADLNKAMGDMTENNKINLYGWLKKKYKGDSPENLQLMIKDIDTLKTEWLGEQDMPEFYPDDNIEM